MDLKKAPQMQMFPKIILLHTQVKKLRSQLILSSRLKNQNLFDHLQSEMDQINQDLDESSFGCQVSPYRDIPVGVSAAAPLAPLACVASMLSRSENNSSTFKQINLSDKPENKSDAFTEDEPMPLQQDEEQQQQYPKRDKGKIILGPNGTEVDIMSYQSIIWTSPTSATRQLLGFVFNDDILSTHTLSGKPSPAFHGRERPSKLKLDSKKSADIIHCVRSKLNCTDREIRCAITTKCSDTAKKYKRRQQKMIEFLSKQ